MRVAERGVAIVLAMGVVAMAAMAATAIMITQSTWSRATELTADHVQGQLLIQAGADWARALLAYDRRSNNVDHLGEPWAMRLPAMPVENGELTGYIEDQHSHFNVNNIVKDGKLNVAQYEIFKRLLAILKLPPALADTLVDWVDADNETQPQGAEDAYYLALDPPYLAANRPLLDVDELALVSGFNENVRARLRPFVTALPRFTAVNPNTATPEVLAAVIDGLRCAAKANARGLVTVEALSDYVDSRVLTWIRKHRQARGGKGIQILGDASSKVMPLALCDRPAAAMPARPFSREHGRLGIEVRDVGAATEVGDGFRLRRAAAVVSLRGVCVHS